MDTGMDDTRTGRPTTRVAMRGAIPVCLTLLALSGCLAGGSGGESPTPTASESTPTPSATPTPAMPAALDATLAAYLRADNRTQYAEQHGLTVEDGRVRVVIGLRDGATLPSGFDVVVELQYGSEVLAYVATTDLAALAGHDNVTVVRTPDRPQPQGGNGSVEPAAVTRSEPLRLGGRR
jgi:hypothetical protein